MLVSNINTDLIQEYRNLVTFSESDFLVNETLIRLQTGIRLDYVFLRDELNQGLEISVSYQVVPVSFSDNSLF